MLTEPHTVLYLFTRKMFSWNAPDFARYVTITSVVSVLGVIISLQQSIAYIENDENCMNYPGTLLILPVLSRYLKWKDGTIGSISMLGNIGSAFTIAFAVTPLMMYLCELKMRFLQLFKGIKFLTYSSMLNSCHW